MMPYALTPDELRHLELTERVASCFSLVGTSFILFTFICSPAFRKPVNRLIFYASWGNTLCNVATLISQSGVRAGKDSHLCQFQGFLIQMFLPADALWNLAMAINVYMTLFHNYNAQRLKTLEWRYHCMCYGVPFLVAFVYIFIETPSKGRIYGPATLWCWIEIDWLSLRIALCYGPAWCSILISFCIYILAGREIFMKRSQLRAFKSPLHPDPVQIDTSRSFKTTEVSVTSELAKVHSPNVSNDFVMPDKDQSHKTQKGYDQYSVAIGSAPVGPRSEVLPSTTPRSHSTIAQRSNRTAMEANKAAFGYTKVALLFFVSLLVTWVPSSINRVYPLVYPSSVSLPFSYASGIVLPLMGFWNALIYTTTSWAAVRLLFSGSLKESRECGKRSSVGFRRGPTLSARTLTGADSDSVKGLALERRSGDDQV